MGKKTSPKGEAHGSPRQKAPRLEEEAPTTTVPLAPEPKSTGKTPPKGEAEGSPRKKAPRLDDAASAKVPLASEPNPMLKTPPKGEGVGSPRKKARSRRNKATWLDFVAPPLSTVPELSELNPSNLPVEGAAKTSDKKWCRCNHALTRKDCELLCGSITSKDAGKCIGCWLEDEKGIVKRRPDKSAILICVECYGHYCCGVGVIGYPFGHSRAHALKMKHWFAILYCDVEKGYCFKCNAEVKMPVKFGRFDDYVVGLDEIRDHVRQLPALPPSVGVLLPRPDFPYLLGFAVDARPISWSPNLADKWHSYEFRPSMVQGYAIRGIPNLGNTCYMNAVLQCLFVLGKLRERILALDRPESLFAQYLQELFVATSAAGGVLNPVKFYACLGLHKAEFKSGMQDSHDFLQALHDIWNEFEKKAPTMMGSIFEFKMAQTMRCKCGHLSVVPCSLLDLPLGMQSPPKEHPTKSAASPQTSKNLKSRQSNIDVQSFPADVQRNMEKMQTISESGGCQPLEVGDSTEAPRICRSKDVVQSPSQIQKDKVSCSELPERINQGPVKPVGFLPHSMYGVEVGEMNEMTADSISIEDSLLLFSKVSLDWHCENCAKDHKKPSASQSKNGEQMVGSGNEDKAVVGDQTDQSDRTACHSKEPECHGGILPAEKQTDLPGTVVTAGVVKQSEQGHTAYQLKDEENEQKDNIGDATQFLLFTMLPPVLTLYLKRYDNDLHKISGHVRFVEYLDVKKYMDPSSIDKGSTTYHLAGVVEHIGKNSLTSGHYIAYVRARRLGNEQEGSSCSSSWFCADDRQVREVTFEQVLKSEALILFYERMED